MQSTSHLLIEVSELIELLKSPLDKMKNLRIIDGTSFPPLDPRKREEFFEKSRIPYSQLFNVDKIANTNHHIPHMLPSEEVFISHMKQMDIRKSDSIIIYDRVSMFGAPRVWYTFYLFGHKNVRILNGGFPLYENEKGELELNEDYRVKKQNEIRDAPLKDDFDYHLDKTKVVDLKGIVKNINNDEIIDARASDRYEGKAQEPRKSLRVGHVEGAKNIFFKTLLDDKGKFLSNDQIETVFKNKGVDLSKNIIAYCGTGLTACIDLFALALLGKVNQCKLYDESWMEYGNKTEAEIMEIKNSK